MGWTLNSLHSDAFVAHWGLGYGDLRTQPSWHVRDPRRAKRRGAELKRSEESKPWPRGHGEQGPKGLIRAAAYALRCSSHERCPWDGGGPRFATDMPSRAAKNSLTRIPS